MNILTFTSGRYRVITRTGREGNELIDSLLVGWFCSGPRAEASEPAEKNALKSIWSAFDEAAAIVTLGFFGYFKD
jgi:hypothetical protein